jgi:hypothetical protein
MCDKLHFDLPAGYRIKRCKHGRIGNQNYCVVEAADSIHPNEAVFGYSPVPSGDDGYSLVCMAGYQTALPALINTVFNLLYMQMMNGRKPLHYVMHCQKEEIITIEHSELSLYSLTRHNIRMHSLEFKLYPMLYGQYVDEGKN